MPGTPSTRQLVALVALVALVLTAGCVLYALTPVAGRVGLWDKLTTAGPGAGALVAAVFAWLGVRRVNGTQAEHGEQLAQITHQTNGVLTARIEKAVSNALDARRASDAPPVPAQRATARTKQKARTS